METYSLRGDDLLFFFHLLCGVIAGTLLTYYSECKCNYIMLTCVIAAIISDLIDKPFMLTNSPIASGRIIGHSLLFAFIVLWVVLFIHKDALIAIVAGLLVVIHELFDSMWLLMTSWLYPFLGGFPLVEYSDPNWMTALFWREVSSPEEWLCAFLVVMILFAYYNPYPRCRQCTI